MEFIKFETSDGETRWINLSQVARATLGHEASTGESILALTFTAATGEAPLRIHGTDDINRATIDHIMQALDSCSMRKAA